MYCLVPKAEQRRERIFVLLIKVATGVGEGRRGVVEREPLLTANPHSREKE